MEKIGYEKTDTGSPQEIASALHAAHDNQTRIAALYKRKMEQSRKELPYSDQIDQQMMTHANLVYDYAKSVSWSPVETEDFETILREVRFQRDGISGCKDLLGGKFAGGV